MLKRLTSISEIYPWSILGEAEVFGNYLKLVF